MRHLRIVQRLADWLRGRPFLRNVVLIAGGTAIAQAVTILTTPLVTRLYLPRHFGTLTVFAALLGLARPLATLRYAVAVPVAEDESVADDVLRLCFVATFVVSLVLALGLLLFGPLLVERYPDIQIGSYFWLLPPCLFGAGVYQALSTWAVRNKEFSTIARSRLWWSGSSAAAKIGLGFLGVRPLGLLLARFAGPVVATGRILVVLIKRRPDFFRGGSWRGISGAARRFIRFPLFQSWAQFLLALGTQLPALLMAALYGRKEAGFYGLAFSMVNLPMNVLGRSVAQVYFSQVAEYGKSRPGKVLELSISVVTKLVLVAAGPLLIVAVFGPLLFGLVFGPEWREAGGYARALAVLVLSRFAMSPVAHCLNVFEKQPWQLVTNLVRVLVPAVVFPVCRAAGLGPQGSIFLFALAASGVPLGLAVFLYRFLADQAGRNGPGRPTGRNEEAAYTGEGDGPAGGKERER